MGGLPRRTDAGEHLFPTHHLSLRWRRLAQYQYNWRATSDDVLLLLCPDFAPKQVPSLASWNECRRQRLCCG